ncbi:MAG: hypothetical protein PVJ21_23630 [Anaerolineales bacterium]
MMTALHTPEESGTFVVHEHITLINGQQNVTYQKMHALIVELALTGPIKVLIGRNRYDHYRINYALAAATSHYEYILGSHIRLSRAETCYQMVELLKQTPADPIPNLILDLLAPFHDESVSEREIDQLLFEAILELRRLNRRAMVTVSAHAGKNRPRLIKVLEKAFDQVEQPWVYQPQSMPQQVLVG